MIAVVLGALGSGKTLLLTIFSQLSDRICYSNYKIRNSHGRNRIKDFKIEYILDEKIEDCDVFLDECYMYMDARKFMNDTNTLLSYFAFQSRKLNLRLFLTSQLIRTIDVRMREMINSVIECEFIEKKGFLYTIYNKINIDEYSVPKQIFLSLDNAKLFFDKYDTHQIIKTSEFENLKRNIAIKEYTKKDILKLAVKCLKFLNLNKLKITKTNISVFCYKNDLSSKKELVNAIYADCVICSANSRVIKKRKKKK